MKGIPMEQNDRNQPSHSSKNKSDNSDAEFISKDTLYSWKKNTAIEIQYLVKDKKAFYNLYLRNVN
jgi:hypothetical protein